MSNLIIFYVRLCYNLITVCHVIQRNSSFVNEKKKQINKQTLSCQVYIRCSEIISFFNQIILTHLQLLLDLF